MRSLGLLIIRLVTGGLLAGHGAQKLFGSFGGHGLQGTSGWIETLGLRPGRFWAAMAGLGEFGGGLLTALGLLHPLGPIITQGPMAVATTKVHGGKPIWVTEGGAELPVINMAVALGLAMTGPGRYSLDRMLRIKTPRLLVASTAAGVLLGIGMVMTSRAEEEEEHPVAAPAEEARQRAGAELQAGQGGGRSEPL